MKFLIFFALTFTTLAAKGLYSRSIEDPVLQNEGRIANGKTAAEGKFNYMVGLDFKKAASTLWCGGSLISENWTLTAAHCTVGASSVKVYLGATKRLNPEKYHEVDSTHFFNPKLKSEITLIRIPTTPASRRIGFVRIPSSIFNKYHDDSVVVTGWGLTSDNAKSLSNDLQYAVLKVSPGDVCSASYGADYNDDVNICVASPNKVSPCHGDSGDPLVLEGSNLLVGVYLFSDSQGCTKKLPLVFTRVSAYNSWIYLHTGIN